MWETISKDQVFSLYQSFISQFIYFYSYSYFKRVYSERTGSKSIGTKANLLIAAAAGACTSVLIQVCFTLMIPEISYVICYFTLPVFICSKLRI